MSEGLKIVLAAFFTVLTFAIGQIIQRIFIEPIQEQRRLLGRIAYALTKYRESFDSVGGQYLPKAYMDKQPRRAEMVSQSRDAMENLGAELRANVSVIPFYAVWEILRFVKRRDDIYEVVQQLLNWSIATDQIQIEETIKLCQRRLGIWFKDKLTDAEIEERQARLLHTVAFDYGETEPRIREEPP